MKTAVSLPNDLFRRAEAAAKKLRISRSALYARAISDFLAHSDSESITERLNALYSQTPAQIDPDIVRAQIRRLKETAW